jgi:hypothetical protein
MTERKKREKVVAEITTGHLMDIAKDVGLSITVEEAIRILNRHGHAKEMWRRMMLAGENDAKEALQSTARPSVKPRPSAWALAHKSPTL